MKIQLTEWDGSRYLQTREDVGLYLTACFTEGGSDAALLAQALDDIARSSGLAQLARESGIDAHELAQSLSPGGHPSFEAVLKLVNMLGLQFRIEPCAA
ncbi:addiction module antidote protein [Pseudoduganella aquatica]|uniref:Putative addiction module antidote protein n=1 Tax=Pseudoduganella aquatica TaxID=2660641 RepID=A0A7X4KQI4_9BURK|nr:addiction module antidote protein [Pseudoduganella aquatica]MYN10960.1 putative addiction module antidote protein [Pseudoduganella aquatica]